MNTINDFGRKLRQLRAENDLTQEGLGNELRDKGNKCFNKSTISRWENGSRKPDTETVKDLEEILGASQGTLLRAARYLVETGTDQPVSPQVDHAIVRQRAEHDAKLVGVAERLLDNDLQRVMKWVNRKGQTEYHLFDESEEHIIARLTDDDLTGRLEENLLAVYRDYTEWFYENCFIPHLFAEWSEDVKTKMSKALLYEHPYELIETLRLLAERKTFKGTCPVCKDW